MSDNQDYLERIKQQVENLHKCCAIYSSTVFVHEELWGKTAWQGDVEIFDLRGHPYADRCYAWSDGQAKNGERFFAVLQSPPITSAKAAVRVSLAAVAERDKATRGNLPDAPDNFL